MIKKSKKRDNSLIKSVHKGQINWEKIRQSNLDRLKIIKQQRKNEDSQEEDEESYDNNQ